MARLNVNHSSKPRCFIGLPLTEDAKAAIKQLYPLPGFNIPSENLHLTLHFLGNIEEEKLKTLIAKLKTQLFGKCFSVTLGELGAFPHVKQAKILWLGVTRGQTELINLHQMLAKILTDLAFKLESRAYLPHLTISRIEPSQNLEPWFKKTNLLPFEMWIDKLILYQSIQESYGSRYIKLLQLPLQSDI